MDEMDKMDKVDMEEPRWPRWRPAPRPAPRPDRRRDQDGGWVGQKPGGGLLRPYYRVASADIGGAEKARLG